MIRPRSVLRSRMSERAQLRGFVHFERHELDQLVKQSDAPTGLLATNPPYGERIGDQERLQALYGMLGQKLREQFQGWKGAVFTGNPPLAKAIGINARRSHTLFNGRIECRLLRFDIEPAEYRGRASASFAEVSRKFAIGPAHRCLRTGCARTSRRRTSGRSARRSLFSHLRCRHAGVCLRHRSVRRWWRQSWAYVQEYEAPRTIEPEAVRAAPSRSAGCYSGRAVTAERTHLIRERRQQQKGVRNTRRSATSASSKRSVRGRIASLSIFTTIWIPVCFSIIGRRVSASASWRRDALSESVRLHGVSHRVRRGRWCQCIHHCRHVTHLYRLGQAQSRAQ